MDFIIGQINILYSRGRKFKLLDFDTELDARIYVEENNSNPSRNFDMWFHGKPTPSDWVHDGEVIRFGEAVDSSSSRLTPTNSKTRSSTNPIW